MVKEASFLAWSYSRWADYCKCPRLFKFKHLEKLKEPPNAAMERGILIHGLAENFLNAKTMRTVPKELARIKPILKLIKKLGAVAEDQWTLRPGFEGSTSWFAKDAWLRMKIDAHLPVTDEQLREQVDVEMQEASGRGLWVLDWKTGRFRPETAQDQLELYALAALILYPKVEFVLATLGYTDEGRPVHALTQNRSMLTKMKARWVKKVEPMQKDTKFHATPGRQCTWCHFSKEKGGPCHAG